MRAYVVEERRDTVSEVTVTQVDISDFGSLNHYGYADVTFRKYIQPEEIVEFHNLVGEETTMFFGGKALIKCQYCGQWAARKTACVHCGGAVE